MTATLTYDDLARWWSHTNGDGEDAHQAARLALLEKSPTTKARAVGVIRDAVREHTADTAFPVRIPASSWRKVRAGTAAPATVTAITAATSTPKEIKEDHAGPAPDSYTAVENRLTVAQLLATLPPNNRAQLVRWFGLGTNDPKPPSGGKAFYACKALLETLRATANNPHAQPWSHNAAA